MNDKIISLIEKILSADLPTKTKDEITRFFLLPRNTAVKPLVEIDDEPSQAGSVKRPNARAIHLKNHPKEAEEQDVMTETLDKATK